MRSYKKLASSYNQDFWRSVNAAVEGVIHTFQNERNMRIHFIIAFIVMMGGIYLKLSYMEMVLLVFAIMLVLIAEMFNTAIECLSDIVSKNEFHPLVKIIKDVSAGAVFVAAINAVITGYMLMRSHIDWQMGSILARLRYSPWNTTLISLAVCLACVFIIKFARREKNLLKGGMPSGHAAVSFAIWMAVSMTTLNSLVSILVFILAFQVAKSRYVKGIHNLWELVAGSVLGALSTLIIFQVAL